jgi:hypothetical protein
MGKAEKATPTGSDDEIRDAHHDLCSPVHMVGSLLGYRLPGLNEQLGSLTDSQVCEACRGEQRVAYANRVQFVKRGKSSAGIAGSNDTLLSSIKSKV